MSRSVGWPRIVLGVFWIVLGSGGAIGMGFESARIAPDPDAPVPALLGTVPFLLASLAAAWNGCGLLAQRRWARPGLSALLLLWGLPAMLLIGAEQGWPALLVVALTSGVAAYSLWFAAVRMNPQQGKRC